MGKSINPKEDHIDRAVGAKLRQRRVALDMSQTMLAKALGITFQQVQKMEKGVNRIGSGRLWQLAIVLGVPIAYFYEGLNKRADPTDPDVQANHDAVNEFVGHRDGQKMAVALRKMPPSVRGAMLRLAMSIEEQVKAG